MKSLDYLTPEEISKNRQAIQDKLVSQGASPVIQAGVAQTVFAKYAKSNDKILDCGPGAGKFLEYLRQNGFNDRSAVDIDNYLTDPSVADLRQADLSFAALPWPDRYFNIVTAWQLVEHLENPHNFIREVNRVLVSDGLFMISMPNVQHIFNRIFFLRKGDMVRWHKKNNHIAIFPKGVFEKTFLKYFTLVEKTFSQGEFPYRFLARFKFPNSEWFGRDVIYVLRKK